jgi:hypothetical protein
MKQLQINLFLLYKEICFVYPGSYMYSYFLYVRGNLIKDHQNEIIFII